MCYIQFTFAVLLIYVTGMLFKKQIFVVTAGTGIVKSLKKYENITWKFNLYELRTLHKINIIYYTKWIKLTMRKKL